MCAFAGDEDGDGYDPSERPLLHRPGSIAKPGQLRSVPLPPSATNNTGQFGQCDVSLVT